MQICFPSNVLTRLSFSRCNSINSSSKGKPQGAITLVPARPIFPITLVLFDFGFWNWNISPTSCLSLQLRPRVPRWVAHHKESMDNFPRTSTAVLTTYGKDAERCRICLLSLKRSARVVSMIVLQRQLQSGHRCRLRCHSAHLGTKAEPSLHWDGRPGPLCRWTSAGNRAVCVAEPTDAKAGAHTSCPAVHTEKPNGTDTSISKRVRWSSDS